VSVCQNIRAMNRLVVIWAIVVVACLAVAQGRKVYFKYQSIFWLWLKLLAMVDLYAEVTCRNYCIGVEGVGQTAAEIRSLADMRLQRAGIDNFH